MARNETKSAPGAKTNRQLAARMKPVAGKPDPRRDKRTLDPAAQPGGLTGLKSDGGERVTPTAYTFVPCSGCDESLSSPKNGRTRRRFDEAERHQVAETRKRGACEACKKSKIKCNHLSEVATFQIQSHERFALGLTTPSLADNRDEHKHVMEEKIAEFDNTLVKAQENISEQDGEASGNVKMKAAASAVTPSPPEPSTPKSLSSQNPRPPPKVCQQTQPLPASSFREGLTVWKLNDGQNDGLKRRKKDGSTVMTNDTLGRKVCTARKTAKRPAPIVYQQGSVDSLTTTTPAVFASTTTNTALVLAQIHQTISSCPTSNHPRVQHGCMPFQASITNPKSKMAKVRPSEPRPDQVMRRRLSRSSDQESRVTTPSGLSFGRSQSPSSDRLPSEPEVYVCMSDVENFSCQKYLFNDDSPSSNVEHFSCQKYLFDDGSPSSDDGLYSPFDVSDGLTRQPLTRIMETCEDDVASSDGMDLDDD